MKSKIYNVIGLMSGTSLDGIDISHVKTDGKNFFQNINNYYYRFTSKFKKELQLIVKNYHKVLVNKEYQKKADMLITKEHFKALKMFPFFDGLDLIGFHGQTIHHDASKKVSIQLGDGSELAKKTNKPVIYNFRLNDLLKGGQGAPLAPIYHKHIIKTLNLKLPCCFLNIGGVSNITYYDGKELLGFDTGPGNGMIDDYVKLKTNKEYDEGGEIALKGKPNKDLVNLFLSHNFFSTNPPKSLDKNSFKNLYEKLCRCNLSLNDAVSTLSELTVTSIIYGIKQLPKKINSIIITGGGYKNKYIYEQLIKRTKVKCFDLNKTDKSTDFIESELIAYITARSYRKLPITFPSTTGVKKPTTGGVLVYPNNSIKNH